MEPIDYEEFISTNRAEIDKDPLNHLLMLPSDDVEKIEIMKKISTVEPSKPELEAELDLHVNECLRSFNSNYKCLVKNYEKYSSYNLTQARKKDLIKIAKHCEIQDYEIDLKQQKRQQSESLKSYENDEHRQVHATKRSSWMLTDLDKLESDPIMPHLFERIPIESIDKENENMRDRRRLNSLFNVYPPQYDDNCLPVENRLLPEPPSEHICNRILVKCTNLKFDLDIEPIWATMALYDLRERRKVSENFSFDLNTENLKQMLNTHQTHQDLSTQARSCIFNITYPSPDLFLVVRIEKVLQQGDIGECAEPYVKSQQQSASSIEKLQLNASQFCERLGKYRMPFVWTAINIMSILNNTNNANGANESKTSTNYETNPTHALPKSSSLDRRSGASISSAINSTNNTKQNTGNAATSIKQAYESFRKSTTLVSSNNSPPTMQKDDPNQSKSKSSHNKNNSNLRVNLITNPQHDEQQHNLSINLCTFKPIAISINTFFKQESDKLSDEDLFRCLNDLKKSTTLIKKLKCLPGSLKMEFSPFNFDFSVMHQPTSTYHGLNTNNHQPYLNTLNSHYILSPELQFIKFLNSNNLSSQHHSNQEKNSNYHQSILSHHHLLPIKEILEFPSHPVYEPNYSYRNLLYIYPLAINLCGANTSRSSGTSSILANQPHHSNSNSSSSSLLNSSSARNIAIKVNFMKGEEDHCALPVLFAKSSSTLEYCKEVFVNVVYHNKTPQYHDEVKIKLPALLSGSNYHLLFTFYHISCQNSKDQNQLETVIGYSWLPLMQQFQFETTVQFTNGPANTTNSATNQINSNLVLNDNINQTMNGQASVNNLNQAKISSQLSNSLLSSPFTSATSINRCQMIKSGIYSLPISFEKLPPGYSNLNYSTFDNSSSSSSNSSSSNDVNFFLSQLNDQQKQNLNSEPNGMLDLGNTNTNMVNINTTVTNINSYVASQNSSNASQAMLAFSSMGSTGYSKSYFDVKLKLVSTIHSQDAYLERFFVIANNNILQLTRSDSNLTDTLNYPEIGCLKQAILDLCYAESDALIKFMFIILDKLFFIFLNNGPNLATTCLEVISRLVQKVTNLLPNQNDLHKRNKLLIQYVKYASNLPLSNLSNQKLFHEELLSELNIVFNTRNSNEQKNLRDLIIKSSWFFFDLIHKSLGIYLNATTNCLSKIKILPLNQTLNSYFTKQLSPKFIVDMNNLIRAVVNELVGSQMANINKKASDSSTNNPILRQLNCSLAFFLYDLLSFIDRGLVFKHIDSFFRETNTCLTILTSQLKSSAIRQINDMSKMQLLKTSLLSGIIMLHWLQLDFLRIINSHEHFLPFNLPIFPDLNEINSRISTSNNEKQQFELFNGPTKLIIESKEYFHRHYLIGLTLRQVFRSLHSPSTHIQFKAVQMLRNILESHDADPRLIKDKLARSKIAYMYVPLINLVIHFIPLMTSTSSYKLNHLDIDALSSNGEQDVDNTNEFESESKMSSFDLNGLFGEHKTNENKKMEWQVNNGTGDNFLDEYDINFLIDQQNKFETKIEDQQVYELNNGLNYIYPALDTQNSEFFDILNDCGKDSVSLHELSDFAELSLKNNIKCSGPNIKQRHSSFSNSKKTNNGIYATCNNSNHLNSTSNNSIYHTVNSVQQFESVSQSKPTESTAASTEQGGFNKQKSCSCVNLLTKTKNLNGEQIEISKFSLKTTQDLLICFMWVLKNIDKKHLFIILNRWSLFKLNKLLILIDQCVNLFEYKSTVWSNVRENKDDNPLKMETTIASSTSNSNNKLNNSKFKTKIEDLLIGNQNNRTDVAKRGKSQLENSESIVAAAVSAFQDGLNKTHNANINNNNNKSQLDQFLYPSYLENGDFIVPYESLKSILEGNLSTECLLISLDTIELVIKVVQYQQQQFNSISHSTNGNSLIASQNVYLSNYMISEYQNLLPNLMTNIMKTLLNALSLEQSTTSLTNLFSHQRALVNKFPELLFEDDSEHCADMCMRLLKHCTSPLQNVRAQASASLYFLMRQNFDIGNNFSRVKMQVTMSLSTLVTGTRISNSTTSPLISNIDLLNNAQSILMDSFNVNCLKRSLKTILYYSESDLELNESSFPAQVKDLVLNLNTILSDTVKMKEFNDDPEMLIDLMHRIANCYQNSPDMRLIWLQNMAQKHLQNQNLSEAGQCMVHAGALVAEYLSMIENKSYLPIGCTSFKNVSINVLEESAVSDDVLSSPYEEGICTGKYFTETGLIALLEQAAVFLMHSQNYEVANQLYKILIPIYEAQRDIKKLSQVHSKLHDCFNKILLNNNRRLFGTYFRVGFYGNHFEELNGEEFIYKEPGITKLAEIAHRLENFYTQKFGRNCVQIMKDSNNVDKSSLDLISKAYIQITYVEPYFDRWELEKYESFFERNYSLKRFIYATPFTLDGKAHGPLNQQYKRKTILTTERAFPYLKTRICVIDKQQIILGPVEVAIEDLQKKIDELKNATQQEPADPKILQMVLQGCVGTTVNQGPLEMAMTFLQPVSSESITEHHNKLRLCFKDFSRRCADALKKNKTLIGPDQFEYQREMERNYNELKLKIDPLIENKMFKVQSFNKNSKIIEH